LQSFGQKGDPETAGSLKAAGGPTTPGKQPSGCLQSFGRKRDPETAGSLKAAGGPTTPGKSATQRLPAA
jgi:hypothetical protein